MFPEKKIVSFRQTYNKGPPFRTNYGQLCIATGQILDLNVSLDRAQQNLKHCLHG